MFDPFSLLLGLSALSAVGKALEPVEEKFEMLDHYNDAIEELHRKGLNLAMRNATLADNEEHMMRHAARMQHGFNFQVEQDVFDFVEDMRVQMRVGEYAEGVFRKAGCTCPRCNQVITNPDTIIGGKK